MVPSVSSSGKKLIPKMANGDGLSQSPEVLDVQDSAQDSEESKFGIMAYCMYILQSAASTRYKSLGINKF